MRFLPLFLALCCFGIDVVKANSMRGGIDNDNVAADLNLDLSQAKPMTLSFPPTLSVGQGETVALQKVRTKPFMLQWDITSADFNTLVMVDPDAPSRENPESREYLHWLVVNMVGSMPSMGQALMEFEPPNPPPGTGLHRYVFVVFRQKGMSTFPPVSGRAGFHVSEFASMYGLGKPVAVGYFKTKHNATVKSGGAKRAGISDAFLCAYAMSLCATGIWSSSY